MNTSDDLTISEGPLYLQVVQEADDEDDRDGQKPEAHSLERNEFLDLHAVLVVVDGDHVEFVEIIVGILNQLYQLLY